MDERKSWLALGATQMDHFLDKSFPLEEEVEVGGNSSLCCWTLVFTCEPRAVKFVTEEFLDGDEWCLDLGDNGGEEVSILETAGIGETSVTSSNPSSKYTTSCIVSWWYSTISLKIRFSRAYTEFSCASRPFSANSVSSCSRIWKLQQKGKISVRSSIQKIMSLWILDFRKGCLLGMDKLFIHKK